MTIEKLMEVDMEFCETTAKLGASGWARFFGPEGLMLTKTGSNIQGSDSIYKAMKPFFEVKGNSLMWSPEGGGISEVGDLGYTYGKYIRQMKDQEGKVLKETGRYLTIWRRLEDGRYKIELDMGN